MGKVVRTVAIIGLAVAVAYFAPVIAAALLPAAATAGATAAVTAAVAATLTIAGTLALNAVLPAPSAKGSTNSLTNFRQSIASSAILYGKRRIGGLIVFFHARTEGKQYYRYFVTAIAGHRCKGVVQWLLNDEVVTVDASGMVTTGPYKNAAWLWFARGTDDQAANPVFVAECGGKWTTEHRGRGVAVVYAKFRMTDDVVQAGMPNWTAIIEGKDDIIDVRSGEAVYTRNAALIFNDWLRLKREEGGFGAYADELDDDWTAAQANVCDEMVATPDGQEARYSFDSVIATGAAPSEIRASFVTSCAGQYTYSGGKHRMRPGYWNPVSAQLSEDDLAGPITLPVMLGGDQVATEVNGTFVDPAASYQPAPIPTRGVPTDDVRQIDLDLAHVTSVWQGQRVTEIALRRAQCEKRLTWPMNIVGLSVEAMDTIQVATPRYGLSNYAFAVDSWSLSQDFGVVLGLREENEEIYSEPDYIVPGETGTIVKADPIGDTPPARAAYQIVNRSIPYPVTSDDDSIMIETFSGVLDDGRTITFPARAITGLAAGSTYAVLWSLAGAAYSAAPAPASAQLASPDFSFLGWSTTSDAGTYPDQPTAPGGWGGNGASNVQEV